MASASDHTLPFGRDSISWRVTTEPAVLGFGGPRALLLQVLHPLIAAGVEDHSDYQAHPWTRLYRTLDTVLKLAFARPEVSAARGRALHARHVRVTGISPDGVPYRALDPDLLLWVWATLVDTAALVYEAAVSSLTPGERAAYYDQQKRVAWACGVPEDGCPTTWDDFRAYVDAVTERDLRVTATTRQVAESMLRPPLPRPLGAVAGSAVAAVAGTVLPARFAVELGLPVGPATRRRVNRAFALARGVARITPSAVRRWPLLPFLRAA